MDIWIISGALLLTLYFLITEKISELGIPLNCFVVVASTVLIPLVWPF